MKRFLIVGALIAAVASPLAAQQESARNQADTTAAVTAQAPVAPAPTAQASTDQTTGPRLRAEFRPAQATSNNATPMYQGSNHTIVISTLVLVLAVIIIVLLVAR